MKGARRLTIVLASGMLTISAHAANWLEISKIESGTLFSIDADSVEQADINIIDEQPINNITVSIRKTYPRADSQEIAKENIRNLIHHSDQQLLVSCSDASYYNRAYVNYNNANKVIASWQTENPILTSKDFKLTSPNTIGRKIVDQTCEIYEQMQ